MKTENGKCDLSKVEKIYTQVKEELNRNELWHLLHLLSDDDYITHCQKQQKE